MSTAYPVLAIVAAYLVGSLSFAVLVSRVMGLSDPRTYGSKNPGATNVLRSGSKPAAALTLLLDAFKGWLPVALVGWFGADYGLHEGTQAGVGIAAFLGHLYPVYFRFQGGKGVATALGVLMGISPWLALATALVWLSMAVVFRYSSLAALTASIAAPFIYVLASGVVWQREAVLTAAVIFMAVMLVWRHRQNLQRLIAGQESKLGSKKKADGATAEPPAKAQKGKRPVR